MLEEIVLRGDKPQKVNTKQIFSSKSKVDKITKDTLCAELPVDNAEIFVETIEKTRKNHLKKVQDRQLLMAGGNINNNDAYRPASDDELEFDEQAIVEGGVHPKKQDTSVILDLNPEKYEKPKDYLFFDFFSLYAKNFIGEKKGNRRNVF